MSEEGGMLLKNRSRRCLKCTLSKAFWHLWDIQARDTWQYIYVYDRDVKCVRASSWWVDYGYLRGGKRVWHNIQWCTDYRVFSVRRLPDNKRRWRQRGWAGTATYHGDLLTYVHTIIISIWINVFWLALARRYPSLTPLEKEVITIRRYCYYPNSFTDASGDGFTVRLDLANRRVHATTSNSRQHGFAGHIRTIISMYVCTCIVHTYLW